MATLSTDEAEDLYSCRKWILDDVEWESTGKFRRLEANVHSQLGEILVLKATHGQKYSFCLLYRNHIPIRRWDFSHRGEEYTVTDAGGQEVRRVLIPKEHGHKHRWRENLGDRDIYVVKDIPLDDVNGAFHAFLDESNIQLKGAYHPVL